MLMRMRDECVQAEQQKAGAFCVEGRPKLQRLLEMQDLQPLSDDERRQKAEAKRPVLQKV